MEETKKIKRYKRLIYKQFVQVSDLCGPWFLSIWRNVSRTFEDLCMETSYWCTVLVHQYGRLKSTKTSVVHFVFIKSLSFLSRASIRAHKTNKLEMESRSTCLIPIFLVTEKMKLWQTSLQKVQAKFLISGCKEKDPVAFWFTE